MKLKTVFASLFLVILSPLTVGNPVGAVVSASTYTTLFHDDFSHGMSNWSVIHGSWSIMNASLEGSTDSIPGAISNTNSWSDFIATFRVKSLSNSSDAVLVRWVNPDNYYRIVLSFDHVEIWLRRNGNDRLLYRERSWATSPYLWPSIKMTDWHVVRVKIQGAIPTISINLVDMPDVTVVTIKDTSDVSIAQGGLGLAVEPHSSVLFADVDVTSFHPDSSGPQRIILLLVEFPDLKHQNTPDQIYESVFLKLNEYYTEVSYNLTWTIGAVTSSWKALPRASTYYNLAVPNDKKHDIDFLQDSISAWDPEVNYSQYDYVFICGAGNSVWGYTWYDLRIPTGDGVTIDRLTAQSESPTSQQTPWKIYVHEFSHLSLELPDLYSYDIAGITPPSVFYQAAVYVGPWDLMSRSLDRPQMMAWDRIHAGWIPENRTFELLPGQQGATMLAPLETPTSSIHTIIVYTNASTYFIVENRQPIGFDSVLPDKGVLISYVDEGKYWRANGPVVVQDANPASGPRWALLHPAFDIRPDAKSLYVNQTLNIAVVLLDEFQNSSYMVAVAQPDQVNTAKSAYANLKTATEAIQNASETGRTVGLSSAKTLLQQAWGNLFSGNFQLASTVALQSLSAASSATTPVNTTTQSTSSTQTPTQLSFFIAITIIVIAIIAVTGGLVYRRKKKRRS